MNALLEAVADEGDRLSAAAGSRIDFDPRYALSRDMELAEPGLCSPNRHCRLIPCRDGWIAVSLARADDIEMIPAWTGAGFDADPWQAVADRAAGSSAAAMLAGAIDLHLPVARVGETQPHARVPLKAGVGAGEEVLDLSALWAGPLCAGLLAEAGLPVVRVESVTRPDPTATHLPVLDARLNGRKRRLVLDLRAAELGERLAAARVLVTSGRRHALARLGLDDAVLFARNPRLLWVAITAHGWRGEGAMRVGFGDDCAASGGLLQWVDGKPNFLGDALADPLTGLRAARLALEALDAGLSGLLDVSLAQTAADFAGMLRGKACA